MMPGTRATYASRHGAGGVRERAGRLVSRRFLYPAGPCAYPVADRRCAHVIVYNG